MKDQNTLNFINKTGIYSITDLQSHYERKTKGHWFKKDTMRFFKSKLNEKLFYKPNENVILFVSSERNGTEPRRYSIREYNVETGNIETIGVGFGGYKTLAAALLAASKM